MSLKLNKPVYDVSIMRIFQMLKICQWKIYIDFFNFQSSYIYFGIFDNKKYLLIFFNMWYF